jgi:hypothetical protein
VDEKMNDVRCPMCGKTNPSEADECQYCEARLQPLTGSQENFTWQDSDEEEAEEVPDWLKALRPPGGEEIEDREDDFGDTIGEERFSQVFQEETHKPEQTEESSFQTDIPAEENDRGQASGALVWPEPEDDYSILEPQLEPQPSAPESDEDLPDWFSSYQDEPESEPPPGASPGEPARLEPEDEGSLPGDEGEKAGEAGSDLNDPDWLIKIRKRHEAEEAEKDRLNQNSLDWLSDPPFPEVKPPPEAASRWQDLTTAAGEEDYGIRAPKDDEEPGPGTEEPMPEWLARLEKATQEPTGPETEEEDFPVTAEEPDQEDLPDWLAKFSVDKDEIPEHPTTEDTEIAAGDLPDWLEAMRPIDSAAPSIPVIGEEDVRPEKVGPLAGFKAIIPAEPEFAHFKKPSAYSIKLHVTDHQQAHAGLLEEILAAEEEPKPVSGQPMISSQVLLRLLITLVLIGVVLLPRWIDLGGGGMPAAALEESSEVQRQVERLPAGAPVLIGFDFEPGSAAELDLTAQGFLEILWGRNVNVVLVSTLPVGPINAERYFRPLVQESAGTGSSYVNLGFIAGGPAGLRSFAENPGRVTPFSIEAVSVWNRSPYSGIETVADFAMLVVITENPETARAWIEQVRGVTAGAEMPFIMIISAQAEPLVRPYYTTGLPGQVTGLLVGWAGGAAMESLAGAPGPLAANWSMFGMGLTAAAVLLLVGGLVSLVIVSLEKRKDLEPDEDEL